MTEDEAKQRWCPFTRATATDIEWHSNRPSFADTDKNPFDTCLGTSCMAWRWRGWFLAEARDVHATPPPTEQSVRLGYCGLAGSPQ